MSQCLTNGSISKLKLESNNNDSCYWKVVPEIMHEVYLETHIEIDNFVPLIKFLPLSKDLCISLMVKTCDTCQMDVALYSDNEIIEQKVSNNFKTFIQGNLIRILFCNFLEDK